MHPHPHSLGLAQIMLICPSRKQYKSIGTPTSPKKTIILTKVWMRSSIVLVALLLLESHTHTLSVGTGHSNSSHSDWPERRAIVVSRIESAYSILC